MPDFTDGIDLTDDKNSIGGIASSVGSGVVSALGGGDSGIGSFLSNLGTTAVSTLGTIFTTQAQTAAYIAKLKAQTQSYATTATVSAATGGGTGINWTLLIVIIAAVALFMEKR